MDFCYFVVPQLSECVRIQRRELSALLDVVKAQSGLLMIMILFHHEKKKKKVWHDCYFKICACILYRAYSHVKTKAMGFN